MNPGPLHRERGVLATWAPEKSRIIFLLLIVFFSFSVLYHMPEFLNLQSFWGLVDVKFDIMHFPAFYVDGF